MDIRNGETIACGARMTSSPGKPRIAEIEEIGVSENVQ